VLLPFLFDINARTNVAKNFDNFKAMLFSALCGLLCGLAAAAAIENVQIPFSNQHGWPRLPGNSTVRLCPVSHEDDLLKIDLVTDSDKPYLQVHRLCSNTDN
jgi:hypothetical protein